MPIRNQYLIPLGNKDGCIAFARCIEFAGQDRPLRLADIEPFESMDVIGHEKQVIPLIKKGLCATVYTQVSDVEFEVNGMYTYDRKVLKLDEKTVQEVNSKLHF